MGSNVLQLGYIGSKGTGLAQRINAPAVVLPHTVGSTPGAKDLYGLFGDTVDRLLAAAKHHQGTP